MINLQLRTLIPREETLNLAYAIEAMMLLQVLFLSLLIA